jgi:ABC-type bacteriocin/lantibiotic exporter with double-glycine peptidase domain
MDKKLNTHLQHLQAFNNQRRAWLVLSFFVVLVVTKIIYEWSAVQSYHLVWTVVTIGLSISVVWWYWAMRLIRQLIEHRKDESEILYDIVESIRDIKEEVKKLPKVVDKDK